MSRLDEEVRRLIDDDLMRFGFHISVVQQSVVPRWVYTIGLAKQGLRELVFAGAEVQDLDEALTVVQAGAARALSAGDSLDMLRVGGLDYASRAVHKAWRSPMLVGAERVLGAEVDAIQLYPVSLASRDTPDMTKASGIEEDAVWRWLVAPDLWPYRPSIHGKVVTDIGFLAGEAALEAARWEEDQWEVFSRPGPDLNESEIRVVALGTALGIDSSLEPMTEVPVGKGLRREDTRNPWQSWG